jgi:ATP-grasp domain
VSRILVLCPTHRDRRELASSAGHDGHVALFHDYGSLELEELVIADARSDIGAGDPLAEIEHIVDRYSHPRIDAVLSTDDYPGSTLASAVAKRLGLPGVDPAVNLVCQHKYYARLAQQRFAPEAVPAFQWLGDQAPEISFPVFVKPVKSFFSIGAYPAYSLSEYADVRSCCILPERFFAPFEALLQRYAGLALGGEVLAESLLPGMQVTLEGYVQGAQFRLLGVVDSIMYPGTLAFQRFEYPSILPDAVQRRMASIAERVMLGIGYENGLFNMEFMYEPQADTIHIIEINPRMSSQFADLFEKVDGTNTYAVLLDLALGRTAQPLRRRGTHRVAASCVLRCFENRSVAGVPTASEIADLQVTIPDLRVEILVTPGKRLSQELQDGRSYRYGIINIGGENRRDILDTLEYCLQRLHFDLRAVGRSTSAVVSAAKA